MSPSRRQRLLTALGIAVASGLLAAYSVQRPGAVPDFLYPWTGMRLFLEGTNPYAAMRGGGPPPYDEALFYPFTALLAVLPLARLPLSAAAGVFFDTRQPVSQLKPHSVSRQVILQRRRHLRVE